MMNTTATTLLVRKDHLQTTTLQSTPLSTLADGQVRVGIDRFALTSNNITYAAMGDAMQYWHFFPVAPGADGVQWGSIPVWGFGTVTQSHHPDVAVGERLYGYFPMANTVDLTPAKASASAFFDGAPHRAELHSVYNQYLRCARDPFYTADTEDVQALLRPLFITSWLIDDFLADNQFFGATADPTQPGPAAPLQRLQQNSLRHGLPVGTTRGYRGGGTDLARQRGLLRKSGLLPPRADV